MTDTFIAQAAREDAQRRAQRSTTLVSDVNPDRMARAQRNAEILRLPADVIYRDPSYDREAQTVRSQQVLSEAPKTAAWMGDEQNAAIAHDNVESMGLLERMLSRGFQRTVEGTRRDLSLLGNVGRALYSGVPQFAGQVVGLGEAVTDLSNAMNPFVAGERALTAAGVLQGPASADTARLAGQTYRQRLMAQAEAIAPKTDNPIASAAYSGLQSVVPSAASVLAGLLSGGSTTVGSALIAAPALGGAYGDARDQGRGLPTSLLYGAGQGSAEFLGEKIGLGPLLDGLRVGSPFIQTFVKTQVAEQLGEQATTVLQDFNEWAILNQDKPFSDYLKERPNAAFQTAVATAVGSGATTTLAYAGQAGVRSLGGVVERRQAARSAQAESEAFDEVRQAVLANPIRERSPERFKDYLRMATPENAQVIVSGEAVASFFQSNPDLDAWMDEWDIRDQVEQAIVAGTDVVFDQATYLGSVVGTEADTAWARDLKFGDKGMSVSEAEAYEAEGEQDLAEAFGRAVETGQAVAAVQSPYDRVQSDVQEQLRNAGMSAQEARYSALIAAERYAARAERAGYANAWEAYQADGGVQFQQQLPRSVQAQRDRLDLVIAAMKARDEAPTQRSLYGDSLLEFISAAGGIEDTGGDLAAMDARAWSNPRVSGRVGRRSLIRRPGSEPGAFGADETLTRAIEAGYFRDDATVNDLFEAIRAELGGQLRFSDAFARNNRAEETLQAADELAQMLERSGIDPATASNEEIRAFVDGMDRQAGDVTAAYDQSELDGLTEDDYIARINPDGKRVAEGDRPNLGMGDMYGMAPKGARQIATLQTEALGRVRFVESEGDVYALANNPDLGEEDVVGYMMDRGGSTELAVVNEAQGKGIGAELSYQFRSRNPFAQSGGLTEAGEATARSAYRRMRDEGRTLFQFAGVGAANAPLQALEQAKAMEAAGELSTDIWETTGWTRGDDGKWRFEISDADAKMKPGVVDISADRARRGENTMPLSDVLDHPALFAAYPHLADIPVAIMDLPGAASGAVARDENGRIILMMSGEAIEKRPEAAEAILIHEVQHLIQHVEGFAIGASTDPDNLRAAGYGDALSELTEGGRAEWEKLQNERRAAFKVYRRSAGEIEARNTEKRRNLNEEERRTFPPNYTRDIKSSEAIVRFDGGGQSLMVEESALRQSDTPLTGPRGQIGFSDTGATITFFKARDRSTFIHEMGHKWLDEMIIDSSSPNATEQTKADMQTILDWFSREFEREVTVESIGVDQHEMWARGWERFLMEGVSPSLELRSVFMRFADWLKRIYRNVARLNAPISDPVREVMSRMIATDEQIDAVREVQNLNRIFADAKSGNMTKVEFEALTQADNAAWDASREKAYKAVMEPLRREAMANYREEREKLREGQTARIDAMPDIAALRILSETGEKLNRQALIDQAGTKEVLKLLPVKRPAIYAPDGAYHPDALATEVGLPNGDRLIAVLMEHEAERQRRREQGDMRPVREARIEDAMDAEMKFLNGDPMTDGTLEEIASNAVHERLKAKHLAMEATQLAQMAGRNALWTVEGIEAFARDTVANLKATKINPAQYLRAERSAGLRAQRALLKQDYAKALDAKLVQVVNFQLYRSAIEAQEEVSKAETLFSKVVNAKDQTAAKARNFDMVNAAREILAAYGLVRRRGQDASAYMASLAEYDPNAYAALKETIDTAVEVAAPLDDLTLRDFRELAQVIDQLWDLSRRTQVMEVEGRRVELDAARGEIAADLEAKGPRPAKRGLDKAVTRKERIMSSLLSIRSYLGKVEEWAMRQGPAFTKYIYRPVSQGADAYRALAREKMPKLEAALRTLRPDIEKPFKIDAKEIGYTFGEDGGNGVIELLGAMRHMGNPSNYRKLILGRGWGTKNADGSVNDSAFQAMMARLHAEGVIQKRHWDYVQAEWDLHEEIKPAVQRAHRRMTGRYFEEITIAPVETPFGTYKGGYVPAKVDPALDARAAEFDLQGILANGANGSFVFPGPANGFTKARVEYNKPLDLDIRKALSQFDEAMRYAMIGPAVQDVTRLLRDREFADLMNDYDQGVWNDFLQPWLVRAVSQRTTEPSDHPFLRVAEGTMSFVIRRTGAMIMFANVVNAAQQITGVAPAMIRTGKRNMATSLRDYLTNPAGMTERVAASSVFMANRLGSEMRDLTQEANRIKLAPGPYGRAVEWTERHAYFLQKAVQNMTDPVIWTAAYNRAVERGEENPVAYADMVIRTTQDSYNPEDASKFTVGSRWSAPFKMFSGYFISQGNLLTTEFTQAIREKDYARVAEIYTLGIFVTAVGAEIIAQGLRGELGDEDDDGWWDDLADVLLLSQLRYVAAFIPFVGQGVNALVNSLDDKPYNDRLSVSPVVSTVEAARRITPNTLKLIEGEGDLSRSVKDYSTVVYLATGLPTFQRQTGYVADVIEGDVTPTGTTDAVRGFVSGRASEESRND